MIVAASGYASRQCGLSHSYSVANSINLFGIETLKKVSKKCRQYLTHPHRAWFEEDGCFMLQRLDLNSELKKLIKTNRYVNFLSWRDTCKKGSEESLTA
jgi:hypothetical protein